MKKNKLSINVKKFFRNGAWVFLIAMAIESFSFKMPYLKVLGTYFIITSFMFFPWLDKLFNLININFSNKNKWFLVLINVLIAAYLIKPEETSYYKCILPISLMILVWIMTIYYLKRRSSKSK